MSITPNNWTPPATVPEAEALRSKLVAEVMDIQAQFSNRDRTDESGRRLTDVEYWAWRRRAHYAMTQKQKELKFLRDWLREHRIDNKQIVVGCVICGVPHPGSGAAEQGWLALRGRHAVHGWYTVHQCGDCSRDILENVDAYLQAQVS